MAKSLTDRQLEIIEASGKLLMEKGILGLTTKNLASEINFSESALYRHFKDKEAILIHLIRYLSENINQRFEQIVISDLPIQDKLPALFQSQFSFFKANPHFIVIILSDGLIDSSDNIKSEIQNLMRTNAKTFTSILKEGQTKEIYNQGIDVEYLVHFTMGSFRLQMLKWKLSNFSFDIEEQGMKTMSNFLQLIKK